MISRHRLRGRGRFAAVRATGSRASAGGLRLSVAGNDVADARIGFALVGLRSAVLRNRLRRRLREAIRPELRRLAGRDAVITAGPEAAVLPYADLRAAVRTAVDRVLESAAHSAAGGSAGENGGMTAAPAS